MALWFKTRIGNASYLILLGSSIDKGKKQISLVKAMVFPVVMYGCESWTIKKAER